MKPVWMDRETWIEFNRRNPLPECAVCTSMEQPTIDHIIPRHRGGGNDLTNLQWLCRPCNSRKGTGKDIYWVQHFYWDNEHQVLAFREAQSTHAYQRIFECAPEKTPDVPWFSLPTGMVGRMWYLLCWIVGAGKTLAIPAIAFALNRLIRREYGPDAPRVDRVLVLCKDQAIRNQVAAELGGEGDDPGEIVRYGICGTRPRVLKVEDAKRWGSPATYEQADIVVTCIQQLLWEKNGQPIPNLAEVLGKFRVIFFDEPHFGNDQVLRLVDAATASLCFALTGSPIEASGETMQRFVLLSIYDYDRANLHDNSLKFVGRTSEELADQVEILRLDTASMRRGVEEYLVTDPGMEPDYAANLAVARSVAERVVCYVQETDAAQLTEAVLAGHRSPDAAVPSLRYPVHAMIKVAERDMGRHICKALNALFDGNRRQFPAELGFRAELICSEDPKKRGKHEAEEKEDWEKDELTTAHPWMWSKRHGYRVSTQAARFLVAVDMAREGVNHLCGVIGFACESRSQVEYVQRIGRALRSVCRETDGVLEVPTSLLDTPRIITHEAYGANKEAICEALTFLRKMESRLGDILTIEELMAGKEPGAAADRKEKKDGLSEGDRLGICGIIGATIDSPEGVQPDRIIDVFGGQNPDRRRATGEWIEKVLTSPEAAYDTLNHGELYTEWEPDILATVLQELLRDEPSDDELSRFIRIHHPDLAGYAEGLDENPGVRLFAARMYRDWRHQYHSGEPARITNLERLRQNVASEIFSGLGDGFRDETPPGCKHSGRVQVHSLVGAAYKLILGTEGQAAANGGPWDIPAVHVLMSRYEVKRDIRGWVRDRLMRGGYLPKLAAAFRMRQDPGDE